MYQRRKEIGLIIIIDKSSIVSVSWFCWQRKIPATLLRDIPGEKKLSCDEDKEVDLIL